MTFRTLLLLLSNFVLFIWLLQTHDELRRTSEREWRALAAVANAREAIATINSTLAECDWRARKELNPL